MKTKEKIEFFLKKGILLSPEALERVSERVAGRIPPNMLVLDSGFLDNLDQDPPATRVQNAPRARIKYNYVKASGKRSFEDFVKYFNLRFEALEKMLRSRSGLDKLTSIQRVLDKKSRETVSIIGLVSDKSETKNGNIILELEDKTGRITVVITKDKKEIFQEVKDIVPDEVIGITGMSSSRAVFADSVSFPDIPLNRQSKKGIRDVNAVFLSDVEIGSKNFMHREWKSFISWIRGESGTGKEKETASKVRYLFVVGDLVAGVGIYPGQEDDLEILDIREQYSQFAQELKKIPSHIQIILCIGNHDAGRLAEPQLPLYKDFAEEIYSLPNVVVVSNPSIINLEAFPEKGFDGFDVLLYHGYSMPFFADNVDSIRSAGGQKRPDLIMQFYLKRRHLAPTHTSNLYIPDTEHDPMVIETIPDIMATGHIHRVCAKEYKGVTLLCCSAWTDITEEQVKRGLDPQPARAVVVNLKNKSTAIMDFNRKKSKVLSKENEQTPGGEHK